MAWHGGDAWDYYPPYMPVGEKKARGALALAKLLKKAKRAAEPVVLAHRKRQLAATFWGQAWADNLERYADLANRLPRGRAYLRNGSVLDLAIGPGRVEAYVAGSELYRVTIGLLRSPRRAGGGSSRAAPAASAPSSACSAASSPPRCSAFSPTHETGCFPSRASWRSTARARMPPRCASTSRRSCTAWRCASTRGRSCSSTCARSTRRS
jgi:hypothetical protein